MLIHRPLLWLLAITIVLSAGFIDGSAHGLDVGVATVDITPPTGMPMRGYAARKALSKGTWDPLQARALVLDDGTTRAALVALDLIAPPPEDQCNRLRAQALKAHGIPAVLFIASHTHSGPSLKPNLPTADSPWLATLEKRLTTALAKATASRRPAQVMVGYGSVDISFDRRVVNPDGTVTMKWRNPERKQTSPVDQTVSVVGFKGAESKWIALAVHFACHPVLFGSKNLKYSADYPGVACSHVEKQLGGTCLFLQGACGNVNPYPPLEPDEEGYKKLRAEGMTLGREVVRIVPQMKPLAESFPSVRTHSHTTTFGYRFDVKGEQFKTFYGKDVYDRYYKDLPPSITVTTPIVTLGNAIAWCGFPGEFFNEFQVDLRKRSPFPHTFFLGYCDGLFSYFPTIQAASEGGYGATYATYVEVGAGERLVDRAIVALHTLAGNLVSHPKK